MRKHLTLALLGGTALFALTSAPAFAQTAPATKPAAAARDTNTIEEVIVTAEKRSENSQHIGVALTALDGAALNQQGIIGFADLGTRVPGLRFGNGVTGGENVITMRGIGSQNTTPGGDSPVAYSVDGVTLQRTTAIDPEFYDVQDIEVLRGPQGTLDGRNSVGGSIHVNTNHPTDDLEGGLDVEIGDYSARVFRGFVNAPLYDNGGTEVNVRITGVDSQHDGYVKNVSTALGSTHNLDGEDLFMLRGQVDIKFSPDVDLLLEASTSHNNDPVATKVQFWEMPARFTGQPFYSSPWKVDNNFPDTAIDKLDLYTATFNWNLGWSMLTNVAGYETSLHTSSNDADGTGLALGTNDLWLLKQQQVSDELRLASNDDSNPLKWVVGGYFFQAQNYEHFDFIDTGLNCGFCAYTFFSHGNLSSRSFAGFGQIDYDLAKTSAGIPLTITAGLRYTDDEKYGFGALLYSGFPIVAPPSTHQWGQWTGKFELAYQFTPDVMGYASISRGYLSGGNLIGLAQFYAPEHVWSYEVGEKANLFNDHLQLNVTAFRENLVNMQVFIQSAAASVLNNAAAAHVNGIEGEATWIPIDGLKLNTAVAITDGQYDQYRTDDNRFPSSPGPGCTAPPLGCSFAGHKLNQTPPYTVELGAEYDWQTSIGTIAPRADIFWSGQVQFLPDNLNGQKAYSETDLHLTWTDPSNRYTLDAFVNNVGNAAVITNDGLQSGSFGEYALEPDNYVYSPPRTFGVRFGVKFGG